MTKTLLLGLLGIAILAAAGFWIFNNSNMKTNVTVTPSGTNSTPSTPVAAATITYDGNSFSPSSVTVKSGDTVAFKNTSTQTVQVQSNPHPLHTDDLDLNIGNIEPGQTVTATLSKTGTFGYHNHLNPSQTGTITIQ